MNRPPYSLDPTKPFKKRYRGSCFCEKVKFEVARDKPLDAKFCHCPTCQKLHGAPFQWAAIVEKTDVHFTQGEDQLIFWNAEGMSQEYILPCKISCKNCRTPIMDEGRNMLLLFPTLIHFENLEDKQKFYPTCHIFYSRRAMDVKDGLPKFEKHKDSSPQIPETLDEELNKERNQT
ncbi:Mss4-like protein [Flammula alnicola]|nr:Mss4-like protein [Flammula alnicola]